MRESLKMKGIWNKFIVSILFISTCFCHAPIAVAMDGGFALEAVLPSNQINQDYSYYYLHVPSGEKQTLSLKIKNYTEEEQSYTITVNDALTNENGVIVYDKKNTKPYKELKYPLSSIVKTQQETVSVGAKQIALVQLDIEMPQEKIAGIIAGGIYVAQNPKKTMNQENGIHHFFSYVKGIVLTQDKHNRLANSSEIELKKVDIQKLENKKIMEVTFLNKRPAVYGAFNMVAQIIDLKDQKILFNKEIQEGKIAPQTFFKFPMGIPKKKMLPGHYKLVVTIEKDGKQDKFVHDFQIEGSSYHNAKNSVISNLIYQGSVCILVGILLVMKRYYYGQTSYLKSRKDA